TAKTQRAAARDRDQTDGQYFEAHELSSRKGRRPWGGGCCQSRENPQELGRGDVPKAAKTLKTMEGSLPSHIKPCKFDQTVELAARLGVDPKQADQIVRGSIVLPHGIGKLQRVVVFAQGR